MFLEVILRKLRAYLEFEVIIMKKKIIFRAFIGIPIGISIGYLFTIFISLLVGDGDFYPCTLEFVELVGSEIAAVSIQIVLFAIIGMAFSVTSLIWEIDEWSIIKQSFWVFLILAAVLFPIAYALYWMEHSLIGFVIYFLKFMIVMLIVWISRYLILKQKIKAINLKIKQRLMKD